MIVKRSAAVSLGLAVGAVGAVALYASASAGTPIAPQSRQVSPLASLPRATSPAPTVSYAACTPPATVEDGSCVSHIVVRQARPAPGAQPPGASDSSASEQRPVTGQQAAARSGEVGEHADHEGTHDSEGGEPGGS
jgi:hypothetical protein